ncbi:MAG TPA: rod shape-determining protein MreD [Burkholderiaceae bacterium]|nr:rod shape-determining protein MreD [Burkholderiaceae bacterium]
MRPSWLDALLATFAMRPARRAEPVELASTAAATRGYRPKVLLRPVNPGFIWLSLAGALFANLLPWGGTPLVPDFLAVALVFWNVQQPRRVGIGAAFVFGLMMDVHDGALFGEHALAYTLLSYGAISLHRRILWFPLGAQAVHVLPLLLLAQLASLLVRVWVGASFPGWLYFAESLVGAALWPAFSWLLLAPQRRPIDRDETRPI